MTSHELAKLLLNGPDLKQVLVEVAGLQVEVIGTRNDDKNKALVLLTDVDDLWHVEQENDCGFSSCSIACCAELSYTEQVRAHNKLRDAGR